MFYIWWSFILQLFFLSLTNALLGDNSSIILVTVLIHSILVTLFLFKNKRKYILILIFAFLIRLIIMFWNIYFNDIFIIPGSDFDSSGFYSAALSISENINLITSDIYGGVYTKFLGILFYLIGPSKLVGQYINVLLSISFIYVIYEILTILKINNNIKYRAIAFISFFPNSILMSSILTREMLITLFVTLSLKDFMNWFIEKNDIDILLSFIYIGIASMFHSGVIMVIIGYSFAYLFYNHTKRKLVFNFRTIRIFIVLLVLFVLSFNIFNELIFSKFSFIEGIDDLYNRVETGGGLGESSYLTGLEINNFFQFVLYGPLKLFYFISSPVPWNWRGVNDVITFLIDSAFYLGTIMYYLLNRRRVTHFNIQLDILFITLLIVSFVFGLGVSNAGTALRHRHKIISLFIILASIIKDEKVLYKSIHKGLG